MQKILPTSSWAFENISIEPNWEVQLVSQLVQHDKRWFHDTQELEVQLDSFLLPTLCARKNGFQKLLEGKIGGVCRWVSHDRLVPSTQGDVCLNHHGRVGESLVQLGPGVGGVAPRDLGEVLCHLWPVVGHMDHGTARAEHQCQCGNQLQTISHFSCLFCASFPSPRSLSLYKLSCVHQDTVALEEQ